VLQLAFNAKEAERQAQLAAAFPEDLLHLLDQPRPKPWPVSVWRMAACTTRRWLGASARAVPGAAAHPQINCSRITMCWNCARSMAVAGLGRRTVLASAPVVVLAGAAEIKRFPQSAELPLKRIRGQITRLPQTAESQALRTVVCAEGYVAPARLGEHTLGASFDFKSDDLTPTTAEHLGNLAMLEEISTIWSARLQIDKLPRNLEGRAAFRCTSPDYLPIVGPWPTAMPSPRPMPR
jgi:tRNA 5-methylaminomethyl-2-thiouridine biosynthesis bifunctional protein